MATLKPNILPVKNKVYDAGTAPKITMSWTYHTCEFRLEGNDVTPREPVGVKYTATKSKGASKTELVSKLAAVDPDDNDCDFADVDAKLADGLLDVITTPGSDGKAAGGSKYDVGSYVHYSREDIRTQGYEIELTESPTFSILDVPGSVTVAGDGAYEAILKKNGVYANNLKKLLVRTDNVSQTVNSFAERDDMECQTVAVPTSAVGVQVYGFDIADAADGKKIEKNRRLPAAHRHRHGHGHGHGNDHDHGHGHDGHDGHGHGDDDDGATEPDRRLVVFVERILAQNALQHVAGAGPSPARLARPLFAMTLPAGTADGRLAVRCVQWNPRQPHLMAVAYGQSACRDYADVPNAVAVWSTKNPYTPERFYEFDGLIITCMKFSPKYPNRLVIGFQSGELILIDVASESLKVLYTQLPSEKNGIMDVFWSIRVEDEFPVISRYECLVACTMNGNVVRYHNGANEAITEKIVINLSHLYDDDEQQDAKKIRGGGHPAASTREKDTAVFRATRLAELHPSTAYLVGTLDGLVYSCQYDSSIMCHGKIYAHFGPIKSLDRSTFSSDVFLTTGCDCSIKIWIGDIFQKPVITVNTEKQVERAVWSRTNSTVIASIIGNHIHVWNVDASTNQPMSVYEAVGLTDSNRCTGMEFTPDGRLLCVTDAGGNVVVYDWSDATVDDAAAVLTSEQSAADQRLMYCIAKNMYGQQAQSKTLIEHRPEYADAFARLYHYK